VVRLWLAALVLVGPLAGKFAGIQQNRAVDYLPDSADSTQVDPGPAPGR
jgi:RND superfamily putative drug exporter